MRVTVSRLRAHIYDLLDHVIETGESLEIERNGVIVRVVAPRRRDRLDRLPRRETVVVGDPEDLVHVDWSSSWNPDPVRAPTP